MAEVVAEAKSIDSFPGMALADLVANAKAATPGDQSALAATNNAVQRNMTQILGTATALEPAKLLKMLPRPEVWPNQISNSRYIGFRCSLPACARSGGEYEVDSLDLPNRMSVRFAGTEATAPSVQEYAVLMAANLTRSKSFDSFVIEYAATVNRTVHINGGSSNDGREGELVVRLFNKGHLPEDLAGAEWRAILADKVLSDFAARPGGGERKPS